MCMLPHFDQMPQLRSNSTTLLPSTDYGIGRQSDLKGTLNDVTIWLTSGIFIEEALFIVLLSMELINDMDMSVFV